jgi:hypothetical protein
MMGAFRSPSIPKTDDGEVVLLSVVAFGDVGRDDYYVVGV